LQLLELQRQFLTRQTFFGIIVLVTVVGVAGGITRDVIFGRFPAAFFDPIYVSLTVVVGVNVLSLC